MTVLVGRTCGYVVGLEVMITYIVHFRSVKQPCATTLKRNYFELLATILLVLEISVGRIIDCGIGVLRFVSTEIPK